jgi:hypothetical protein
MPRVWLNCPGNITGRISPKALWNNTVEVGLGKMEEKEQNKRREEFRESKKPLNQRLIEGLGLEYDNDSYSFSVRDVRIAGERVTDFRYLREKLRNHRDLLEKLADIFERAIEERPISALFGKI